MPDLQNKNIKPTGVIRKGYLSRLFLLLLSVFIIGTTISTVYLYYDIHKPLSTHYSAIISILSNTHETLIIKTIKINTIFFILIIAGILILGILYTHRLCGPLCRLNFFAKSVGEGKLDKEIKFRGKDAVHLFADTLSGMAKKYGDRVTALDSEIQQLKTALTEVKSSIEENKDKEIEINKVLTINERIKELLGSIKI